MSFQVGSVCYSTEVQAAQAQASSEVGRIVGANPHTVSVTSVAADSITYTLSPIGGGASIIHVAPFTPQPCNMLDMSDGLTIGWAIAGAWIGAYALVFLAKALRGETGDSYGNT